MPIFLINLKNKLKKARYFVPTIIVAIILFFIFSGSKTTPEIFTVKKGNVIQSVNLTGRVKGASDLKLAFERTGTLASLYVATGQKVARGQLLARLINNDLGAQYQQALAQLAQAKALKLGAQATLDAQKAKLNELENGARVEEIAAKNNELALARQNLDSAYQNTINIINGGFVSVDDALRKQISDLFLNADSQNPKLSFLSTDSQAQSDVEFQKFIAANEMKIWEVEKNSLTPTSVQAVLEQALITGQNHTRIILKMLDRLMDATTAGAGLPAATLSTYKTNVTTARTNVNAVATNFSSQLASLKSQKISLEKIHNELALKLAGNTNQTIEQQKQAVKQAEANVASQDAQIQSAKAGVAAAGATVEKSLIRAPVAGTVVKITPQIGSLITANTPIISLVSLNQMEIEVNISEIDVGKIKINNPVSIQLDAYPAEIFEGTVASLDPGETIMDGVVNYRAIIAFNQADERIKSGLTADVTIETRRQDKVMILPRYTLIQREGKYFVKRAATNQEVPIQVGLRGQDNAVEIISGVAEGDQILSAGPKNTN